MRISLFLLIALFFLNSVSAHDAGETAQEINVNERLGAQVPLDIPLYDEEGGTITLKKLIHKPTVIVPVYLSCNNTCPVLLMRVADVIEKSRPQPCKNYQVFAASFECLSCISDLR